MRKSAKAAKTQKLAAGGSAQSLASRVAAARQRNAQLGTQARPLAANNPRVRPQHATNNLESIKARLLAAGSTPGNRTATTTGIAGLFGTGQAMNQYAPINPASNPAAMSGGDTRLFLGGVSDDLGGNKKGGVIKKSAAAEKALRKKAKK